MFDAARQSWQPVARHPEVRAAWAERERYRPPGSALELPPLPDEAEPVDADPVPVPFTTLVWSATRD